MFGCRSFQLLKSPDISRKLLNPRSSSAIVSGNEVLAMHDAPQGSSQFTLKSGERITDCSPLWTSGSDRILEEIANCNHCLRPTYRVIAVTSVAGLERRASLCVQHFVHASRTFSELRPNIASVARS